MSLGKAEEFPKIHMSLKIKHFYEFKSFRLDAENRMLWSNGTLIALEPKVANTLLALVQEKGGLVGKEELIQKVWEGLAVTDDSLTRNISILRRILGSAPDGRDCIKNVPKRGYCFNLPVSEKWEELPPREPESQKEGVGSHSADYESPATCSERKVEPNRNGSLGTGYYPTKDRHIDEDRHDWSVTEEVLTARENRVGRQVRHRFWVIAICTIASIVAGGVTISLILPSSPTVVDSTQLTRENRELSSNLLTDGSYIFLQKW